MPSKTQHRWLVFIISIAILLVGTELMARALGFGKPVLYRQSASGYEVVPNQDLKRLFKKISYNEFGLRGQPISAAVPPGTLRILCLGDSITYGGAQAADDETYASRIAQKLGAGFEVVNASAGGWSVFNEYLWIKDHGLFGAKLVMLEVGQNDLFQPFVDGSLLDRNVSFPTRDPATALSEITDRYLLPALGVGKPSADPGVSRQPRDEAIAARVLDTVSEIHRLVRGQGATLVLLYIDPPVETSDDPAIPAARDRLFDRAKQEGIELIRPKNHLEAQGGRSLFRDSIHPNAAGNEAIAAFAAPLLSPLK